MYEVDEVRDLSDPTVAETDRFRRRIAELEQVVRELRQRQPHRYSLATSNTAPSTAHSANRTNPAAATSSAPVTINPATANTVISELEDKGQDSKKRRVIVDRFARFKIDEAAMAAVASAAAAHRHDVPIRGGGGGDGDGDEAMMMVKLEHDVEGRTGGAAGGGEEEKKDYRTEPYTTNLLPGEEMVYDRIGRRTFLGATAGKSMLRRVSTAVPTFISLLYRLDEC